jgi:hypothetical protein
VQSRPVMSGSVCRWAIPIALGLAVLVAVGDAVRGHSRQHPALTPAVPDRIGLTAVSDGDALRLEWSRTAETVRTATDAVLYIEDGKSHSQMKLNESQLAGSSVRYWPETQYVRFRLEVHGASRNATDQVEVATKGGPSQAEKRQMRAVVEKARPSPFERPKPEVVRKPSEISLVAKTIPKAPEPAVQPKESRFGRMVGRIPLLRRLRKHPQAPDPPQVADTDLRR